MQLSDGEWTVMNFIWDAQPTEASDVTHALASDNHWTEATVKTMLHRLVKKGALAAEPAGKRYRYRAAVKRSDCIRLASRTFLEHVFGGAAAPALLHLVKSSKLSADEVAQLRQLLDAKDPTRKESKEC